MNTSTITGRDRIEASFEGKKLDRCPVFLLLGSHYAEKAGFTVEQFLTEPEAALETTNLRCEQLDTDIIFVPLNPLAPEAMEIYRKRDGKEPGAKKPDIKEKLPKWTIREPRSDQLYSAHLDMCEICLKEFPEYHVQTHLGGPWTFALELRGANEAMVDIYDDKPFLHDLMDYTTETVIARCMSILDIGVFPFISDPSAGMSLISPDVYREYVLPYHRRIVDAVHVKGGILSFHICGYVDPIYEDLVGLGIDGLSIDQLSSLEKFYELAKGKVTIMGNVDPILFIEDTPDQLQAEAKKCFEIIQGEARYIVGAGCQLPPHADLDKIQVFIEACHEYGQF